VAAPADSVDITAAGGILAPMDVAIDVEGAPVGPPVDLMVTRDDKDNLTAEADGPSTMLTSPESEGKGDNPMLAGALDLSMEVDEDHQHHHCTECAAASADSTQCSSLPHEEGIGYTSATTQNTMPADSTSPTNDVANAIKAVSMRHTIAAIALDPGSTTSGTKTTAPTDVLEPPPPTLDPAMQGKVMKIEDAIAAICVVGGDRARACIRLLVRLVQSILENPTAEKYKTIKTKSRVFTQNVSAFPSAIRILETVGFAHRQDEPPRYVYIRNDYGLLWMAASMLSAAAEAMAV
jgi:hypothetical protein